MDDAASGLFSLEVVLELSQRGPSWIRLAARVLVGLDVQVFPADRAQAGAVGAAENLLGNLERDRVPRPGSDLKLILGDVVRTQLVPRSRIRVVELARRDVCAKLGTTEAAHAGTDQARSEAQVDHRRASGLRELEIDADRCRAHLVALPAEQEGLELDVQPLATNLAGPKAEPTKVERLHWDSVAPRVIGLVWHSDRHRSPAAEAFAASAVAVSGNVSAQTGAA